MNTTIFTSFSDPSLAEKAVGALMDHGVRSEDVSVVRGDGTLHGQAVDWVPTRPSADVVEIDTASQGNYTVAHRVSGDVAHDTKTERELDSHDASADVEKTAKTGLSTTTAADAEAGAVKGVGWGAGIGILAAVASLAIPGFGIVLGGGALAIALGGVAASAGAGAAAGAVTGYLKDQGMDEHLATDYGKVLAQGGLLLAVTVPSGEVGEMTVRQTLEKYGAVRADQFSAAYVS